MRASIFAASLLSSANALLQTIQVAGSGTLTFTPDALTAPVGSQVQFTFYPRNHSVASGAYGNPCQPDGRIFSGYEALSAGSGPQVFTITINDTEPIWYYCSVQPHCQSGMVGVINPPTSGPQTLASYRAAAANAPKAGDVASVVGGVLGPLSASTGSSSVMSSTSVTSTTATTTTTTSTSQPVVFSYATLSSSSSAISAAATPTIITITTRRSACSSTATPSIVPKMRIVGRDL